VEGPLFEAEKYPLQHTKKKHFEPVGKQYLKHNTWEKIDRELSFIQCSLLEAGVNTEEAASTNPHRNIQPLICHHQIQHQQ
jgi:hypothetical protein